MNHTADPASRFKPTRVLTSRARAHLKALAHGLRPVVQIGLGGLTPAIAAAAQRGLYDHELIKVRLGSAYVGDRKRTADELASAAQAHLVALIGRVIVLYRPRPHDLPNRPRIQVP
jgi:RNA-binding protein